MVGTSILLNAAASEMAEPLIHEKPTLVAMFTYPRLPRRPPKFFSAATNNFSVAEVRLAIDPNSRNIGTATSGKLLIPATTVGATLAKDEVGLVKKYRRLGIRMANAMGVPRSSKATKPIITRTRVIPGPPALSRFVFHA